MTTAEQKVPEEQKSAWETESGLMNDFDGWIKNARFGKREEYASKISVAGDMDESIGNMFLIDLVDESGEVVASQGYSIGTGWSISEDGFVISHPKRNNVIHQTIYGQLQHVVTDHDKLNLKMDEYGVPTDARSWEGLGFHWELAAHATLKEGETKQTLMPTAFLNVNESIRNGAGEEAPAAPVKAAAPKAGVKTAAKASTTPVSPMVTELTTLVKASKSQGEFALKAMKIKGLPQNDALMAQVLDEGPAGFYATHK